MTFTGTYAEYLRCPYWRAVRRRALERAGYQCQRCPRTRSLEVHHRTYERLGCERPEDLEVLCDTCHKREHGLPTAPAAESVGSGPELLGDIIPRALARMGLVAVESRE